MSLSKDSKKRKVEDSAGSVSQEFQEEWKEKVLVCVWPQWEAGLFDVTGSFCVSYKKSMENCCSIVT